MNALISPLQPHLHAKSLRCLWLSRDIPFPQDAGDRIYSANLALALAHAGAEVRYLGYLQTNADAIPHDWINDWVAVRGEKRNPHAALLSRYPRIAAVHATRSYKQLLQEQLRQHWDAIVLDGYGSGWALPLCLATRAENTLPPLLIYVSHNHEEKLWLDMVRATDHFSLKRLVIWQNYRKARVLERELVKHAQLITTITTEDAQAYQRQQRQLKSHAEKIVLTPGFSGPTRLSRHITIDTPRHVVMMGSYRWLIKQENLRQLILRADPVFTKNHIVLDVIGDVPDELLRELQPLVSATRFHGFVTDLSTFFDQARMALVPEVVGGGFKLKFLDYVFGRVPVAAITAATAGVPSAVTTHIIRCQNLDELIDAVIRDIDNLPKLNDLQEQAHACAAPLFRWDDRGQALADTIRSIERHA